MMSKQTSKRRSCNSKYLLYFVWHSTDSRTGGWMHQIMFACLQIKSNHIHFIFQPTKRTTATRRCKQCCGDIAATHIRSPLAVCVKSTFHVLPVIRAVVAAGLLSPLATLSISFTVRYCASNLISAHRYGGVCCSPSFVCQAHSPIETIKLA